MSLEQNESVVQWLLAQAPDAVLRPVRSTHHLVVEGTLRGTVRFRPSLAATTKVLRQLQGRPVPAKNGPAVTNIGHHGRTVLCREVDHTMTAVLP